MRKCGAPARVRCDRIKPFTPAEQVLNNRERKKPRSDPRLFRYRVSLVSYVSSSGAGCVYLQLSTAGNTTWPSHRTTIHMVFHTLIHTESAKIPILISCAHKNSTVYSVVLMRFTVCQSVSRGWRQRQASRRSVPRTYAGVTAGRRSGNRLRELQGDGCGEGRSYQSKQQRSSIRNRRACKRLPSRKPLCFVWRRTAAARPPKVHAGFFGTK